MNHTWLGIVVLIGTSGGLAYLGLKLVKEFKKWYDDK